MDTMEILRAVRAQEMTVEEAELQLRKQPFEDLGFAKLDLHRKLRSGFPETVFCQGKPDESLAAIFETLYRENGEVLGTRASQAQYELVRRALPGISYDPGTEQYLRLLGKINCWLANMADEVYEVSCGLPICVKCAENSAQRAC